MSAQLTLFETKRRAQRLVRMGLAESRAGEIRLACIDCGFDGGWFDRGKVKLFGVDADTICPVCNGAAESRLDVKPRGRLVP